jgi:hypothetical protein
MPLIKAQINPGVIKDDTDYDSEGRWVDTQLVRFWRGKPQSMGGWQKAFLDQMTGSPRSSLSWNSQDGDTNIAIGTSHKLYSYTNGELQDITPAVEITGTLSAALTTVSGSTTITVAHPSHGLKTGDVVGLSASAAVGGLTIKGTFQVTVLGPNSYTFVYSLAATSSATGGGTITYFYPRSNLTDPFTVTAGNALVVITHPSHGRSAGDYVHFEDASPVGGLTVNGEYTVTTVLDANSYTITHGTAASFSSSGGGTISYLYEISIGNVNGLGGAGYGTSTYGTGLYGQATTSSLASSEPRIWSLSNDGDVLVANPWGGKMYEWKRYEGGRATRIPGAPTQVDFSFITPERFLVALGTLDFANSEYDPMLSRWSDRDNRYQWTPAGTNQSGEFPLSEGGQILKGMVGRGESVIFTDKALYSMRYTGDIAPTYEFNLISTNVGLLAPMAAIHIEGRIFWATSTKKFYVYSGGVPEPLECPVRDFIFDNLSASQEAKTFIGGNSNFNEFLLFYPTDDNDGEISNYVIYNYVDRVWANGTMERTSWIDSGSIDFPIAASPDGYLYFHEEGDSADGSPMNSWAESGDFDIQDGQQIMFSTRIIPDFRMTMGALDLTIKYRKYPNGTQGTKGPYEITPTTTKIHPRIRGRQWAIRIEANATGFWRLGDLRVDVMEDGEQ